MLRQPRFRPHLHVETVSGEGIFVLSDSYHTVLHGRLYELVAPQLDGSPVEELYRRLQGQASVAQIHYTLNRLEQQGLLCEAGDCDREEEAALWTVQGLAPGTAACRLAEATVAIRAFGIDAEPLGDLLKSLNVRVAAKGDVCLVVTDHYLRPELKAWNKEALESGQPWFLIKPVGCEIWIGPLLLPGKTACWECLAQRIRANRPVLDYLDRVRGDRGAPALDVCRTPATLAVGWGLAANAVASFLAHDREQPLFEGKIQTLDLLTYRTRSHTLVKQPACSVCGGAPRTAEESAQPLVLSHRKKTYTEDGGHRALSPQETLDKYSDHVSSICGIVSVLERSAAADEGVMHVYLSGNNVARGHRDLANLRADLRSSTCGKGTTDVQAKAGALCEAIERYSGIFQGNEPRRAARYAELGDEAIHPHGCLLFSARQYQERESRNTQCATYNYVPMPFDPERKIEWTPVWSLTHQAVRYLPAALCYFDYPSAPGYDFGAGCSNGNAAGNCLEEAILQGLLELVERDSVGLWWYNRAQVPGLDLDSIDDPYLPRLRSFLQSRHRDLWILDVTSDLQIPAFTAVSRRTAGPCEEIMFGFGAHLDPKIALLRAVTELNQMLVPLLEPADDGQFRSLGDPETVHWLKTATTADHPYLLPRQGPLRRWDSYPKCWTDDLKEDILFCQRRIEALGLELLVLDQTRPEIGMPVAKTIVPGLRHFWARFAPGRLYDVPAKLGWQERPLDEDQLNPIPMFL